ncbi:MULTISPECIES: hypothetical protein [Marinobacter]|jgi:hypothetical protein|uniref:hypothetical protein n=1 Tax=Marinobacter TaxID=2742 RepID=UPI00077336B9|nr:MULTISPECIES: hypothetical protein [Marinobacter]MCD1631817.1 hypothetical protein [Marinobacter shengliensis]
MKLKLYYSDGGKHPVLGQIYHQRQEFSGELEVARYQRYLANTLTSIAQNIEDCDRILSKIKMFEEGKIKTLEVEGNDVDVFISNSFVQININVNDDWVDQEEGRFSLEEFKAVLSAWRKFLNLPESLSSEITAEL